MSKKIKKSGLLLTDTPERVSVVHEGGDFFVCFDSKCDDNIFMRMTIPHFRVIASLILHAVNHLEPDSPLASALQKSIFDDFNQLLKLVGHHAHMVRAFKNSPR